MKQKLLFLLVLLLTATTGAWATDYTTLAVGDVIKVGDTFRPTVDGAFNDMGVTAGDTYTLMRADVDIDVTEKTDGAYYVFKFDSFGDDAYIHFEKAFAVTAISDGLEVTNIETGKEKGNLYYTLAVHEPAAASGYTVSLKDGVKDAGKWTVKAGTDGSFQSLPLKGVKAGTKVKLKYDGDRSMVKGVTAVKAAKKAANVHSITIAVDPSTNENKATAPAMTIEFNTGEKWADVAARYDWLGTYETYTVFYKDDTLMGDVHDANGGVKPDQTIDPNGSYHWGM